MKFEFDDFQRSTNDFLPMFPGAFRNLDSKLHSTDNQPANNQLFRFLSTSIDKS